jgi:hypothetical protein
VLCLAGCLTLELKLDGRHGTPLLGELAGARSSLLSSIILEIELEKDEEDAVVSYPPASQPDPDRRP